MNLDDYAKASRLRFCLLKAQAQAFFHASNTYTFQWPGLSRYVCLSLGSTQPVAKRIRNQKSEVRMMGRPH